MTVLVLDDEVEKLRVENRSLRARVEELEARLAESNRMTTAQEVERLRNMTERVHQLEKEKLDFQRSIERMIRRLGAEAVRGKEPSLVPSPPTRLKSTGRKLKTARGSNTSAAPFTKHGSGRK